MKTKLTALALAAATAFALTPKPAVAGDKGLAVVGGLIGGLIIGSAIADSHDTRVVYVNDRHNDRDSRYDRRDAGYWKTVTVNVWVPGYWITERYHGRSSRRFVPGYYERRNDRVWVAYDRHDRRDDRGYGNDYRR